MSEMAVFNTLQQPKKLFLDLKLSILIFQQTELCLVSWIYILSGCWALLSFPGHQI